MLQFHVSFPGDKKIKYMVYSPKKKAFKPKGASSLLLGFVSKWVYHKSKQLRLFSFFAFLLNGTPLRPIEKRSENRKKKKNESLSLMKKRG